MIKILFFAALRERLNCEQTQINYDDSLKNVAAVIKLLQQQNQHWCEILTGTDLLCAVNHQLATLSAPVKDGDELAFFPPVTGG